MKSTVLYVTATFTIALGFSGDSVVENPFANAEDMGDMGSIPRLGKSPGVGNGNTLQYSCLENSMDKGAWEATVYGIAKSHTQLSNFTSLLGLAQW